MSSGTKASFHQNLKRNFYVSDRFPKSHQQIALFSYLIKTLTEFDQTTQEDELDYSLTLSKIIS